MENFGSGKFFRSGQNFKVRVKILVWIKIFKLKKFRNVGMLACQYVGMSASRHFGM